MILTRARKSGNSKGINQPHCVNIVRLEDRLLFLLKKLRIFFAVVSHEYVGWVIAERVSVSLLVLVTVLLSELPNKCIAYKFQRIGEQSWFHSL